MPNKSRQAKAYRLLKDVARGPASIGHDVEAKRNYNLWVSTWVLPTLVDLIPELKGAEIRVATTEDQHEPTLPGYTTKEVKDAK